MANGTNILVFMTDNQEKASVSEPYMSTVMAELAAVGTSYDNALVSYPLCCPSRATFLTGQYAHNHRVMDNVPPLGGYGLLDHSNTLPVWLQGARYYTAHLGRYLFGYGKTDSDPTDMTPACLEVPPGWDEWYGVAYDTFNSYDYVLNDNGTLVRYGDPPALPPDCPVNNVPTEFQTDMFADRVVDFIERRAAAVDGKPFFLMVAFNAPHGTSPDQTHDGPVPAPRHLDAFKTVPLPRPVSFDEEDVSDKPSFVQSQPRLGSSIIRMTVTYRRRLESLLAVDEAIARSLDALRRTGQLADTVVIFTSDQGQMLGEHRVRGLGWPYEESIGIPLMVRGPGFAAGQRIDALVANIDIAPTIVDLTGATAARTMDGRSLVPLAADPTQPWRASILLEATVASQPQDYHAIRSTRYVYISHLNAEEELYDLAIDPHQLASKHADPSYQSVRDNLLSALDTLRECTGDGCWQDPSGRVPNGASLPGQALHMVKNGSGEVTLTWAPSCLPTDTDYAVYEGVLGDLTSLVPKRCSTDRATSTTLLPGAGDRYYSVVPRSQYFEGGFGWQSGQAVAPPGCLPAEEGTCR